MTRTIVIVCAAAMIGASALFAWSLVRSARVIPESLPLASIDAGVATTSDRSAIGRP